MGLLGKSETGELSRGGNSGNHRKGSNRVGPEAFSTGLHMINGACSGQFSEEIRSLSSPGPHVRKIDHKKSKAVTFSICLHKLFHFL